MTRGFPLTMGMTEDTRDALLGVTSTKLLPLQADSGNPEPLFRLRGIETCPEGARSENVPAKTEAPCRPRRGGRGGAGMRTDTSPPRGVTPHSSRFMGTRRQPRRRTPQFQDEPGARAYLSSQR